MKRQEQESGPFSRQHIISLPDTYPVRYLGPTRTVLLSRLSARTKQVCVIKKKWSLEKRIGGDVVTRLVVCGPRCLSTV